MDGYFASVISHADAARKAQWERLLRREGISPDRHLDHTIGLFDSDCNLAAAGSCSANTLRCLAVDGERRGEGLLAVIVSHLLVHLASLGITHVFLYTKRGNERFFHSLGFSEIASAPADGADSEPVSFMENRRGGFSSYLAELTGQRREETSSAVVMNCNPFTLGHRSLIETASRGGFTHVFVVSEDASFFPFADRFALIERGVSDLPGIALHKTESYMISNAVFPSYFMEDDEAAIKAQAGLDVRIFQKIALALDISRRYAGTEPFSRVTGIYNDVMRRGLPAAGIEFIEVPRAELGGRPVSASRVRELIKAGDLGEVRELVPDSTYDYLLSSAGRAVIKKIAEADSVAHY